MAGPRPRYFPVTARPLTMRAGLSRFGTDHGNGALDAQYFQRDDELPRYLAAKAAVPAERHVVLADRESHRRAHRVILAWVAATLAREHGLEVAADPGAPRASWLGIAAQIQEDLAIVHRGSGNAGEAIGLVVCFPSGWRPERLAGASFRDIHGPVPGFADAPRTAASMLASMIDRGPYVRFVWTVSADDHLDHHPEQGQRVPLREATRGWLRVERQVTVPFPHLDAALFLVRTIVQPFDELDQAQRATLAEAIHVMPAPIARYKGLDEGRARILALLGAPASQKAR